MGLSPRLGRDGVLYGFLTPILLLYAVFSLYSIVQTFELSGLDADIRSAA